jgi:uncharacterized protein
MIPIEAQILNSNYSERDLSISVAEILHSCNLMAMASSLPENGGGYANTAYFSYNANLSIYFISDEDTQHSLNIVDNPLVSAAIWLTPPVFAEGLRGIQLFGRCVRAVHKQASEGLRSRKERFSDFQPDANMEKAYIDGTGKSGLFVIETSKLKIIDEPRFGRRNYIDAVVVCHNNEI